MLYPQLLQSSEVHAYDDFSESKCMLCCAVLCVVLCLAHDDWSVQETHAVSYSAVLCKAYKYFRPRLLHKLTLSVCFCSFGLAGPGRCRWWHCRCHSQPSE